MTKSARRDQRDDLPPYLIGSAGPPYLIGSANQLPSYLSSQRIDFYRLPRYIFSANRFSISIVKS